MRDGLTRAETPAVITIHNASPELMTVTLGDGTVYDIVSDTDTGDWLLASEDDTRIQGFWFRSNDGATQYLLKYLGLIEAAAYSFAPDRC
jgi:hypothetical protein